MEIALNWVVPAAVGLGCMAIAFYYGVVVGRGLK